MNPRQSPRIDGRVYLSIEEAYRDKTTGKPKDLPRGTVTAKHESGDAGKIWSFVESVEHNMLPVQR